MEKCCLNCRFFEVGVPVGDGTLMPCYGIVPFPEVGCSDFLSKQKNFVLVHLYLESGYYSIVAFSDSLSELKEIRLNHPRFGSHRHDFMIIPNSPSDSILNVIKDNCLINICKNVAEYLAVGEYAMLKKSYYKSASWFEKAKNSASLGADIIDNY